EVCERAGHDNGQPTHPERNTPGADLYRPPEYDPQEVWYGHDYKHCSCKGNIGFSAQNDCLSHRAARSASIATTEEARWERVRHRGKNMLALCLRHFFIAAIASQMSAGIVIGEARAQAPDTTQARPRATDIGVA